METRNRIKGINPDECANLVRALRVPIDSDITKILCNAGSGGDKIKTINVSTSAAVILATAGVNVLKNGYKGVTGKCGSRDLLTEWGIDPFQPLEKVLESVKRLHIGYYDFANIIVNESRSGFRSPLNYIGVLCHPLKLTYKMLGCGDESYLEIVEPIVERTCENYLLTYNPDIDEISSITPTHIREKRNGVKKEYEFNPRRLRLINADYNDLLSSKERSKNASIIIEIFKGKRSPKSELIAINAGG
ncbi:MAG: hypothetical protein AABY32_05810, partial [Nanoarchaeota archaeon]